MTTDSGVFVGNLPTAPHLTSNDSVLAWYTSDSGNTSLRLANLSVLSACTQLTFGTPANNESAGLGGQMMYDSSYLYVCVSNNAWGRVALDVSAWTSG